MIRNIHDVLFPSYKTELRHVVGDCKSLLDVGCGKDSPIRSFAQNLHAVGVDVFAPALEQSKENNIHSEYYQMNVMDIGDRFQESSFECVLASDLVEHLDKKDGLRLLDMMEHIASRRVIIFTPRGFLEQHEYENNPWQEHRSGWDVDEMKARGYTVIGINGMKWVWNIPWLWRSLSAAPLPIRMLRKFLVDITQLVARWFPSTAFQILCVKNMDDARSLV